MKKYLLASCFILLYSLLSAQTNESTGTYESLKQALSKTQEDTHKVLILLKLCYLENVPFKESLNHALQGLALSEHLKYYKGRVLCGIKAGALLEQDYRKAESIALLLRTSQLCEKVHDSYNQAQIFRYLGYVYSDRVGLNYHLKSLKLSEALKISEIENPINGTLAM